MLDPNDRFLTCRGILRWHYGHRSPEFDGPPRRHYSLHYTYRNGDQMYVASKVRKERGRVPFHRQFAILRALGDGDPQSVVRPPVRPRRGGRDWVTGLGNRWFVRSYTEHDQSPDWLSLSLVRDAARKLATVHRTSSTMDADVLRTPAHNLRVYDWPLLDVLGQSDAVVTDMRTRDRIPRHIDMVSAGLGRLRAERRSLDLGPEGLTHHDLRTENILVRDGEVVEIVDWDRAHWDVQWYDVTLAGLHLANQRPGAPRWDLTDVFLDAYRAESGTGLSADALAWLFRFTAIRNLAVSRSPDKWARLLPRVEERWGDGGLAFVNDFVAEDQVAPDLNVTAEDGGTVGAVTVG
ncbi:phosphotransferase [Spirillospora sp. CA-142024]|uniref:phosphotransferase n=1 Tax=Spirillospora sp. CA-142024 TaxID=3240036 RepID=UPI003D8F6318